MIFFKTKSDPRFEIKVKKTITNIECFLDYNLQSFDSSQLKEKKFINDLSEYLVTRFLPECNRHNSLRTLSFLRLIPDIENTKEYKRLKFQANSCYTRDASICLQNEIFELGGSIINSTKKPPRELSKNNLRFNLLKILDNYHMFEDEIGYNDYNPGLVESELKLRSFLEGSRDFSEIYSDALNITQSSTLSKSYKDLVLSFHAHSDHIVSNKEGNCITDNFEVDYMIRTKQLDSILNQLTRAYCSKCCTRLPYGCCTSDYFKNRVTDKMLALQEIESIKRVFSVKPHNRKSPISSCFYHLDDGCKLQYFKSPICIGFICIDIENKINQNYDNIMFKSKMLYLRGADCNSDKFTTLRLLDDAIIEGKKILELG